jgi:RNA polymerase sigma factor (sigma-70 family)
VSVEGVRLEIEGCRQTVYRVMLRYCGNPSDAEDLTQEAILKSLQSAHLYRGRARVCTWVVTIATYVYLTKVRKRVPPLTGILGHSETKSTMLEEVGALECVGGIRHEKDPHQQAEQSERRRKLEEALSQLPKEDAMILRLYHFEEFGYDELAGVLEKSQAAVKMQASRARAKLRTKIQQMGCAELFEDL